MTTSDALDRPDASPAGDPLADGRSDAARRRYDRVLATITEAGGRGREVSVSALARAAGVHRSYLYRHPDLLDLVQQAESAPAHLDSGTGVSVASLRADLAHARDRATRAEATVRDLQSKLSRAYGQQVWAETGLGADTALEKVQRDLETSRQQLADTRADLAERTEELDAARAANRELMATLNSRRG